MVLQALLRQAAANTMSNESAQVTICEDLSLDLERKSLFRGAEEIHLRPKSLEVLTVLAENAGRVVSKNELIERVWGNVAASDDSLAQCLIEIRRAVGDSERTLIRTVPRQGYLLETAPSVEQTERGFLTPLRITGLLVALVVVTGASWWRLQPPSNSAVEASSPAVPAAPSIAVLPFVDMSESQDQAFLGEGIAEEILNLLVRSDGLRVIARTSSFALRDEDIAAIRNAFNVTHVLEGSVRRVNDQLRITTQLIDAESSVHLWSNTYDKTIGDIFDIQSDIAVSVAAALEVALNLTAGSSGVDPYAHALVLQARALGHSRQAEALPVARDLLEKALRIDPNNVRALTELSRIMFLLPDPETGGEWTERTWRDSIALRERAQAIAPDDVVANAYEAFEMLYHQHDFEGAARLFERVSSADPQDLDVLRNLQSATLVFGNWHDGAVISDYLRDRDPFCVTCSWMSYNIHLRLGEFAKARRALDQLLLIQPEVAQYHPRMLGEILLAEGRDAEALAIFERLQERAHGRLFGTAIGYFRLGRVAESDNAYRDFIAAVPRDVPSERGGPYQIALLAAGLEKPDEAFAWLEQARQVPPRRQAFQASYGDLHFRNLHDDPRWNEHMEKVGLSERQRALINFKPTLPPRID